MRQKAHLIDKIPKVHKSLAKPSIFVIPKPHKYIIYSFLNKDESVKNQNASLPDLAVKIDGIVRYLIEVKSAGTELRDRHIEQAQHYASQGNIRWVVLTNGLVWNLYHLSFDEGIEYEPAFTVNLTDDSINKSAELLSILHRQSIIRGGLEDFWRMRTALSAKSIGKALFHEDTLRLVRRIIRKQEGILLDEEDLGRAMQSMFSPETREQIGPFKIRRRSSPRRKIKKGEGESEHALSDVEKRPPPDNASVESESMI